MTPKVILLSLLCFHLPSSILASYGGHDFFTSLEAMKLLWQEEKFFAQKLENVLENVKSVIPHIER